MSDLDNAAAERTVVKGLLDQLDQKDERIAMLESAKKRDAKTIRQLGIVLEEPAIIAVGKIRKDAQSEVGQQYQKRIADLEKSVALEKQRRLELVAVFEEVKCYLSMDCILNAPAALEAIEAAIHAGSQEVVDD